MYGSMYTLKAATNLTNNVREHVPTASGNVTKMFDDNFREHVCTVSSNVTKMFGNSAKKQQLRDELNYLQYCSLGISSHDRSFNP